MNIIDHIQTSIDKAEKLESKLIPKVIMKDGLSSIKIRHFLNNLCSFDGCKYLEIGTCLGSTFCSAVYNNAIDATCVDIWSNGGKFVDYSAKITFLENLTNTLKHQNQGINSKISIIDQDCFTLPLEKIGNKFNVFMYDGDHSYQATRKAMTHFKDILADNFVLIVDDWNCQEIRDATVEGIKDGGYKGEKYWELEGQKEEWKVFSDLWWNGLFVVYLSK